MVFADDRSYEKKDRNVDEPMQFYSGKDPALYEIVVNAIAGQEHGLRLSLDAEERAGSADAALAVSNRARGRGFDFGLITEAEGEVEGLARIPLLLGHAEGGDESPLRRLAGLERQFRRQRGGLCHWRRSRISQEDALVLRRGGGEAGVDAAVGKRHIGHDLVQEDRLLALVVQPHAGEDQNLVEG